MAGGDFKTSFYSLLVLKTNTNAIFLNIGKS